MPAKASTLVLGWGNPSRGDDAIGPVMVERLRAAQLPGVRVETDYQLQIEHVVDIHDCSRVVFVDAAVDAEAPFTFSRLASQDSHQYSTHALAPSSLLGVYRRVYGETPPPAFMVSVAASSFELGEALSAEAGDHLDAALAFVTDLVGLDTEVDWESCYQRHCAGV